MYFTNIESAKEFLEADIKINPKTKRKISNIGKIYEDIMKEINILYPQLLDINSEPVIVEKQCTAKPILTFHKELINHKLINHELINNDSINNELLKDIYVTQEYMYKGPLDRNDKRLLKFRNTIYNRCIKNKAESVIMKDKDNCWIRYKNILTDDTISGEDADIEILKLVIDNHILYEIILMNIIGIKITVKDLIITKSDMNNIKCYIINIDKKEGMVNNINDIFRGNIKKIIEEKYDNDYIRNKIRDIIPYLEECSQKYKVSINNKLIESIM
jgi:hypothetical protein